MYYVRKLSVVILRIVNLGNFQLAQSTSMLSDKYIILYNLILHFLEIAKQIINKNHNNEIT